MSERTPGPGVGQMACPFVAFDDDRERRSTQPDHRHRCYAETPPAARALAHQERYCLSTEFPACPTFQDWVRREAARPAATVKEVAAGTPPDPRDYLSVVEPGSGGRPRGERDWTAPPPWLAEEEAASGGQLRAFDDLAAHEAGPEAGSGGGAAAPGDEELAELVRTPAERPRWSPDDLAPPTDEATGAEAQGGEDEAQAPAFLADRRRPAVGGPSGRPAGPIYRQARPASGTRRRATDPEAPSWERPRRLEDYGRLRTPTSLPDVPPLLLGIAALILAAAVLFLLPGLLSSPAGSGPTPTPSLTPTPSVSLVPTPTPAPSGQVYVVQANDTLSKIAARFHLTLAQLLAANPQIKDPNKITIGDRINIPPAGGASASP